MPKTTKTVKKVAPKSIQLSVLDTSGKVKGKVAVPHEVFAAKINPRLMAQAVRVYHANQRAGTASTKTRGEVEGSTRKIYRQKGTGRARHGAIRAPIFVGGGITFGPQPHGFSLSFPKKMKRAALMSALSGKIHDGDIIVVDGLETLPPKTKAFAKTFSAIGTHGKTLVVVPKGAQSILRGAGNLTDVDLLVAPNLTTYAVLSHNKIVITKTALPLLWNK